MTVEASARLNPVWRDMLIDDLSGMVLLASIHPDNNRPEGDEDVVARALMFRPDGELGRLTIRSGMLRMADETFVDDLGGTCSDAHSVGDVETPSELLLSRHRDVARGDEAAGDHAAQREERRPGEGRPNPRECLHRIMTPTKVAIDYA